MEKFKNSKLKLKKKTFFESFSVFNFSIIEKNDKKIAKFFCNKTKLSLFQNKK